MVYFEKRLGALARAVQARSNQHAAIAVPPFRAGRMVRNPIGS